MDVKIRRYQIDHPFKSVVFDDSRASKDPRYNIDGQIIRHFQVFFSYSQSMISLLITFFFFAFLLLISHCINISKLRLISECSSTLKMFVMYVSLLQVNSAHRQVAVSSVVK